MPLYSANEIGFCQPFLDEAEAKWNKWLGKSKDERIKKMGPPDRCSPLTDGGEVCEWRVGGVAGGGSGGSYSVSSYLHKVIYVYDREHIARSWSYRGNYGARDSTNIPEEPSKTKTQEKNGGEPETISDTEINDLLTQAREGKADSQFRLASRYHFGQGVTQDDTEAAKWLRLAAEQGHTQALMGLYYALGMGVRQDQGEAAGWFRLAAEKGDAVAQKELGDMYKEGKGVPQDFGEAVRWYRLAADQGDAVAQLQLGAMYIQGKGVPHDPSEAIRWTRLAAEQGNFLAQALLGSLYMEGRYGIPQDYTKGYMWLHMAAGQKKDLAQKVIDEYSEN